MQDGLIKGSALRISLGLASMVVVIAGMKAAAGLIVPFLLSAFIAIICAPIVNWLMGKGLSMWLAMTVVIISMALFGTVVISIMGTSIHHFGMELPQYQAALREQIEQMSVWLDKHGVGWYDEELRKAVDPGSVLGFVGSVFNGLGALLTNGFLIFLTVVFMLFEGNSLQHKVALISGRAADDLGNLQTFLSDVNRYMTIKSITSLATGILVAIWMAVLGVEYALLWGVLAFLLNYIPNIGSIIAAVPAVLLALVSEGLATGIWAAIGYLIINTLIGNIVEPKYLGDKLGMSTLVVFLSLVFWGWVLGTIGMFLAVPLTMVVKLAFEACDDTRWIAVLMGIGPSRPGQTENA